MTIIFLGFIVLCLFQLKPCANNEGYMSREQTQRINAVFVFLIFMSHFVTYVDLNQTHSEFYLYVRNFLKQMVVVTFLFFSGYGMFESFKKKGEKYVRTVPMRFLKLLLRFDLAVILFYILSLCIGVHYKPQTVLLSLTGWSSLGNSNWYVFVILCLYIVFYFSFRFTKERQLLSALLFTAGSIGLIILLMLVKDEGRWYNTILCFTAGVWYSYIQRPFEKILGKSQIKYGIALLIMVLLFFLCHSRINVSLMAYEFTGIFFCMIIVLLSKRFYTGNRMLKWLGNHVFSIYILQRIPMIIGRELGLNEYVFLYFFLSLVGTALLAILFDWLTMNLEKRIFTR